MIARIKRPANDFCETHKVVLFDKLIEAVDDLFNTYKIKLGGSGMSKGLVISNRIAVLIPINKEVYALGELDQDADDYPRGTLVFEFEKVVDKRLGHDEAFTIMFYDLGAVVQQALLRWRGVPNAEAMNWDTIPLCTLEQE